MNKKLIVLSVMLIAALSVKAQTVDYKAFRVGLGLGYAKPGGKGASGGVLWTLEPGYRITDQILANLRIEGAVVARGTADETSGSFDAAAIGSYTLNGQYYFMDGGFRPYAGLGFGMFALAAVSADVSASGGGASAAAATKLGFYPRFGFDAGHFTINIDYNFIPPTKANVTASTGTPTQTEFKNSYLGIRIGGFFGGGRKNK